MTNGCSRLQQGHSGDAVHGKEHTGAGDAKQDIRVSKGSLRTCRNWRDLEGIDGWWRVKKGDIDNGKLQSGQDECGEPHSGRVDISEAGNMDDKEDTRVLKRCLRTRWL